MKPVSGLIKSLAMLALFAFGLNNVFAEKTTEIYKWIDKEGYVHYAARPGNESAEKMHLGSRTFHKKKKADVAATQDNKNDERAKLCQDSEKTLAQYKKAPFLYRYDEERKQKIRLTEAETKDTMLQAEKDVSYWCNPPVDSKVSKQEK